MQYLLTPLHTHFDFGFGRTGDAFKAAADTLDAESIDRSGVMHTHLPINYLRRHAVELYLKSIIVIVHRRLGLPYGVEGDVDAPRVQVGSSWREFQRVHSIRDLWTYVRSLFRDHKSFFDSIPGGDYWTLPAEADDWVEKIELLDPRSTFFRYPEPRDPTRDQAKAFLRSGTPEEIIRQAEGSRGDGAKQFVLLLDNEDGELVDSYYYSGEPLESFSRTLNQCVENLHALHAAMRALICDGC